MLTAPNPDFTNELARRFTGELRFDPYARALYATDASIYQIEPLGVAFPKHTEDVLCTVELCAKYNIPIIARGGGSGLAGQAIGRGLLLDCSRHLTQLEINAEEKYALAEVGVVCDALNAQAARHGLQFGCAPSSSNRATVGGMVANNATGAHSILYGMTGDQLLGAEIVLADAARATLSLTDAPTALAAACTAIATHHAEAIRAHFPKTWRRASGYSINQLLPSPAPLHPSSTFSSTAPPSLLPLLAGSEGTLAVLTRTKLNLVPRPKHTGLCLLQFDSIQRAAEMTPAILESQPSAIELLSRMIFELTRAVPAYARLLTWLVGEPAAVLAVEFQGESEAEVLGKIQQFEERQPARTSTRALTAEQQASVWAVRKAGLGLIMSMRGAAKPVAFMEDVTAPVEHLGEFVREIDRIFSAEGVTQASYYGHASAGCLHIRPVLNLKLQADVERMRRIANAVLDVVKNLGGAMSGEHGDGLARSCWNERLFGAEIYQAFREIKHAFDPRGLLNPGKIVDAPDFTENLRYGPHSQTLELHTHLDFGADGGFVGAVEQCNGAGACRKDGGVMCPSFHATRDEEHSTRGRANALRAALSGRLPANALTSQRMHQVLDLCLECKACKAECPSAVDMAKIKYEWLAHYQAQNGVPLRSQVFANIATVSSALCHMPRLANALLGAAPMRWLNEKLLGISRHRTLPRFAGKTFRKQFRPYVSRLTSHAVVLFIDTWTNYNHPEIGHAAVKVLRAAGFEPQVVAHGCCGRPMISKGLLAQAKETARRNVEILAPYAERGWPSIGLEPSCILTFRDEYLDLLPNNQQTKQLAQQSFLIEEFITQNIERFAPLFAKSKISTPQPKIFIHGHCYQKALTGTKPLLSMLRLTGAEVQEINSGCCGMAGSFGYEAEHYEISMKIGEERLFPAVRAANSETMVAASGVSCRHQIQAGTGRAASHPIEVLAQWLGK